MLRRSVIFQPTLRAPFVGCRQLVFDRLAVEGLLFPSDWFFLPQLSSSTCFCQLQPHLYTARAGRPTKTTMASSPEVAPLVDIAPTGDVVFAIGPENAMERLRVQSSILRTASTVFAAMLGPHFAEGQGLSSESPKEVRLPEDDPAVMKVIFNALHFRFEDVADPLDPDLVLRAVIAADKYDVTGALQMCFRVWLNCKRNVDTENTLWRLAMASALVGNEEGFRDSTRKLLLSYGGAYARIGDKAMVPPDMVGRLAYALEVRREQVRAGLVSRLLQVPFGSHDHDCWRCRFEKIRAADYLERILHTGVTPERASTMSVLGVTNSVRQIVVTATPVRCEKAGTHAEPNFRQRIQEVVDEFIRSVKGLDLAAMTEE
ncbi:hypothetical protein VTK26DRAFT_9384 [Humicola hyalothermophila]